MDDEEALLGLRLDIPQGNDLPPLNHVDENGRIKVTPPLPHDETPPLPPTIDDKDHPFPTHPLYQKNQMEMRKLFQRVNQVKTMDELEKITPLKDHLPKRDRKIFTKKLDDIRMGIESRVKLKRALQLRELRKMAKGGL